MQKLFGKKVNKKFFYITLSVIIALVIGAFLSANFFQKAVLSRIDFSDFVALGSAGKDENKIKNDLDLNITSKIYDDDMCVHFLNVGKADCAYIKCKKVNILIDAADREPAGVVTEYLKRQKVQKLDMVVMSHPHRDHIGQMAGVIKEFRVDKFIEVDMPKDIISTTWTYENMLKALVDKKVSVETVLVGNKIKIGDLKIEILGPVHISRENMNDNSIVMKITYKDVSFLFTGDAAKAEENDIIKHYGLQENRSKKNSNNTGKNYKNINNYNNAIKKAKTSHNPLKSNVLKVGHHGSNSSSTSKFLNLIHPDYAVISTASKESMGLPSNWRWRALERLEKCCNRIYKTYESGNVIFLTDGKTIKVETEK